MSKSCRTYYLQMLAPKPELLLPIRQGELISVGPNAEINRAMYLAVGSAWGWTDKASWSLERWQAYVNGFGAADVPAAVAIEQIVTSQLMLTGEPAGYFELSKQGFDVELRYFGLLPHAIGLGYGGALLGAAITAGWQLGAQRLWVHTCDLDHKAALANYQRRGFELYKTALE